MCLYVEGTLLFPVLVYSVGRNYDKRKEQKQSNKGTKRLIVEEITYYPIE